MYNYTYCSGEHYYSYKTEVLLPEEEGEPFPTINQFEEIVNEYLRNLSPKKRYKALIDQNQYYLIQEVLKSPKNTAISTAQFRFWVKKMFRLESGYLVYHNDKPVAVKEHIYSVLLQAHKDAIHGGRDKTAALVRDRYSWIPKELIASFVRSCPTCIMKRNKCSSEHSGSNSRTPSPKTSRYAADTTPSVETFSSQRSISSNEQSAMPPQSLPLFFGNEQDTQSPYYFSPYVSYYSNEGSSSYYVERNNSNLSSVQQYSSSSTSSQHIAARLFSE